MRFNEEEGDLETAMRLSMVTFGREQQRNTNGRGANSSESFEHLFEDVFSDLQYVTPTQYTPSLLKKKEEKDILFTCMAEMKHLIKKKVEKEDRVVFNKSSLTQY
jgi:hypothetical protein